MRHADAIDRRVAERIRECRISAGITREDLADSLGVSVQQLQKYETARNRISAGRLHAVAAALARPVATFFEQGVGA